MQEDGKPLIGWKSARLMAETAVRKKKRRRRRDVRMVGGERERIGDAREGGRFRNGVDSWLKI